MIHHSPEPLAEDHLYSYHCINLFQQHLRNIPKLCTLWLSAKLKSIGKIHTWSIAALKIILLEAMLAGNVTTWSRTLIASIRLHSILASENDIMAKVYNACSAIARLCCTSLLAGRSRTIEGSTLLYKGPAVKFMVKCASKLIIILHYGQGEFNSTIIPTLSFFPQGQQKFSTSVDTSKLDGLI